MEAALTYGIKIDPREIENADFYSNLMAAADLEKEANKAPKKKSNFMAGLRKLHERKKAAVQQSLDRLSRSASTKGKSPETSVVRARTPPT